DRLRSKSAFMSLRFLYHRFQDFFGRHRDFVNSNADGIVYGVCNCGGHREKRALPNLFGSERPAAVVRLNEIGLDFRHFVKRRALIFKQGWIFEDQCVGEPAWESPKYLFFHQRFAKSHVDASFDLATYERWIDRPADIVGDPNLRNMNPAGVGIDLH